jgi:hypothetical protein
MTTRLHRDKLDRPAGGLTIPHHHSRGRNPWTNRRSLSGPFPQEKVDDQRQEKPRSTRSRRKAHVRRSNGNWSSSKSAIKPPTSLAAAEVETRAKAEGMPGSLWSSNPAIPQPAAASSPSQGVTPAPLQGRSIPNPAVSRRCVERADRARHCRGSAVCQRLVLDVGLIPPPRAIHSRGGMPGGDDRRTRIGCLWHARQQGHMTTVGSAGGSIVKSSPPPTAGSVHGVDAEHGLDASTAG